MEREDSCHSVSQLASISPFPRQPRACARLTTAGGTGKNISETPRNTNKTSAPVRQWTREIQVYVCLRERGVYLHALFFFGASAGIRGTFGLGIRGHPWASAGIRGFLGEEKYMNALMFS